MVKYLVRCPACKWATSEFEDRFEADEAFQEHVKEAHPNWPEDLHFRRETII